MIILYTRENCPYSASVIHKMEEFGIRATYRDVHDNRHALSLMEKGGKYQVPCLIDTDSDKVMYESGMILQYLDEYNQSKRPRHAP